MLLPSAHRLLLLGTALIPNVSTQSDSDKNQLILRARRALISLQDWYDVDSGLWETTGWWNGANIMTMIGNLAIAAPDETIEIKTEKHMLQAYASIIFAVAARRAPTKNPNPDAENPKNQTLARSQNASLGTGYHKYLDFRTNTVHAVYPPAYAIFQSKAPNMAALVDQFGNKSSWPIDLDPYSFLDGYYDDDLWWALAWITAYDVTKHTPYLTLAEGIFAAVSKTWPTKCHNGGIYWNMTSGYVNAIANELFLSTAAHLANRVEEGTKKTYVDWAKKSLDWFLRSGMINANNTINDGLDENCNNNNGIVWSYNQGVILGGLAELAQIPHSSLPPSNYIDLAFKTMHAAIEQLADKNGVIHDVCQDAGCGADGSQFKGIFVRNLHTLQKWSVTAGPISGLVRINAESIWSNKGVDEQKRVTFGVDWAQEPNGRANASTQSSAMDCLVADIALRG